ncbi:M48 family metallopeptidase [Chitinophaga qingshengii]|uniref:M48 family metalloprotease n=1 Tax=Chitinophaga qingshengii TaxID=1569794 RepID=A0ABR7TIX0_9BACT|nr:M48 family metallopeptidase [Chitinophaga qingshengii]MBC9930451.1 M48 family metalloprotease [Chitinophaga qingshengii]
MTQLLYPVGPERVFEEKLRPTPAFRRQAVKAIAAILLFLFTYVILLAAAVLLVVACGYAGIFLISLFNTLTIILGGALIFLGIAVLYFLIKFAFAQTDSDKPGRKEITEAEQPELFAFIRQLTQDTGTPFPKKIFLSPDVNACVFYHSSFWSMFLPVRKNLEIGVGLVTCINLSEFKAVMAHEFGHFSQRSMKLGSFTYNANHIIYNMLYDNEGYSEFISSVGSVHAILAIFAYIAAGVATGIQSILRIIFRLINKSYMGLSREMEYHADTIAASVAGGNNVVSSLARIEMASSCYNAALNAANERLNDKKQYSLNLYDNQLSYFKGIAYEYNLPLKNGLPDITFGFLTSFGASRINYDEQWASHPTLEQRKANMEAADMNAIPNETSAGQLFRQFETLQQSFTRYIYGDRAPIETCTAYSADEFEQWVYQRIDDRRLPEAYKGFYDKRLIDPRDRDLTPSGHTPVTRFDELFNDANAQLWTSISWNQKDIALLKAFQMKDAGITHFDFDGNRYSVDDCYTLIAQLEAELNIQQEKLQLLDKQAFDFFLAHAGQYRESLQQAWQQYREIYLQQEERKQVLDNLDKALRKLVETETSLGQRCVMRDQFLQEEEAGLKTLLQQLLDQQDSSIDELLSPLCSAFISSGYRYFDENQNIFLQYELEALLQIVNKLAQSWQQLQLTAYKSMLETQLRLYEQAQAAVHA